jgi:hypothetical protein
MLVYAHLPDQTARVRGDDYLRAATIALAGLRAIGAIAQVESGNYASSGCEHGVLRSARSRRSPAADRLARHPGALLYSHGPRLRTVVVGG